MAETRAVVAETPGWPVAPPMVGGRREWPAGPDPQWVTAIRPLVELRKRQGWVRHAWSYERGNTKVVVDLVVELPTIEVRHNHSCGCFPADWVSVCVARPRTVQEAVDILAALNLIPACMSSAYRLGCVDGIRTAQAAEGRGTNG